MTYSEQLFSLLFSPVGMILMAGFITAILMAMLTSWMKWVLLAFFAYFTTVIVIAERAGFAPPTLSFPLQQLATYGRPLCILILGCLFLPAVTAPRGWRTSIVTPTMILYLILELFMSVRLMLGGYGIEPVVDVIVYLMIFMCVGVGVSRWLQSWEDVDRLIKAMALTNALFVGANVYQLVVNRAPLLLGFRFQSTAGNPQMGAIVLSVMLLPSVYLLMRTGSRLWWRVGLGTLVGFSLLLIIWTGSRTGALMTAVGLAVFFRQRLGRMAIFAIVALGFVLIASSFLGSDSGTALTRLTDPTNTRWAAWQQMWGQFTAHPLYGAVKLEVMNSESSYLMAAARYGILGLVLLGVTLISILHDMWTLNLARSRFGNATLLVDMVLGMFASLLTCGFFEGILLGRLTIVIAFLYVLFGLVAFLKEVAGHLQAQSIDYRQPQFTNSLQVS